MAGNGGQIAQWLSFDPQAGHEQAGRRPALVLSPKPYNQKSGLALVCPVTNQMKEHPFEVPAPRNCCNGSILGGSSDEPRLEGASSGEDRPCSTTHLERSPGPVGATARLLIPLNPA